MKRRPGYLLQRISGTEYLLPYGQQIADHQRGISLNSTGVSIWNLLEKEPTREELQAEYLNQFSKDAVEKETLLQDLNSFLDQLISWKIIEDDPPTQQNTGDASVYLKIAGLVLAVYGPNELIDASFLKAFCTERHDHPDQRISVIWGKPAFSSNGTVLLRNRELVVCERETDHLLLFPTFSRVHEVSLSKDGRDAAFYCEPPVTKELGEQFFHVLRHVFLYLAATRHLYAIHSASICYQDKAWLFSASAGTGKSTHTNLWKELYGTPIFNGDLNLLGLEDGHPVVHGLPWCGTSELFDTRTIPLGGIILLKRAVEDFVAELSPDRQALQVMQRFISPMWTGEQLRAGAEFAEKLSRQILICQLHCTKNPSAAQTMREWIDGKL